MTQVDTFKKNSGEFLAYWQARLIRERQLENKSHREISVIPDTLEWFLWMIETRCTIVMSKKPWWKFWRKT